MPGHTPFTNVDPATAADARRGGLDPHELDRTTEQLLTYICTDLVPDLRVPGSRRPATGARLRSLVSRLVVTEPALDPAAPCRDGADRISLLTDAVLRNVVARLPVKDAARTAALSSRWRRVWLSTPLVLIDAHLRPEGCAWPPTPADSPPITAAVSSILEAHAGPVRCAHLTCSHMSAYQPQLARWLHLLAAKGVQDLVLVNRPWPLEVPLPAALFTVATLTRLYVGLWKLPDVARLASFPHLRELGICSVVMEDGDIDIIVAKCPSLETLSIHGSARGLRLRLVSHSLRCVQICCSILEDIGVVTAPRLERLILEGPRCDAGGLCATVRIGDAPKLLALGILEPGNHILEIRDTTPVAGIKASPSTMATSVKILSLNVRFGNHNNAKMVPAFLGCFPNLKTLHVLSGKCDYQAGSARLNLKFWESAKPTENVKSCIKEMSFRDFRGELGEIAFLKFFFRNAKMLSSASIYMAPGSKPSSMHDALSKVEQCSKRMANKSCQTMVLGSTNPEGGRPWSFKRGTDYSREDPFVVAGASQLSFTSILEQLKYLVRRL